MLALLVVFEFGMLFFIIVKVLDLNILIDIFKCGLCKRKPVYDFNNIQDQETSEQVEEYLSEDSSQIQR